MQGRHRWGSTGECHSGWQEMKRVKAARRSCLGIPDCGVCCQQLLCKCIGLVRHWFFCSISLSTSAYQPGSVTIPNTVYPSIQAFNKYLLHITKYACVGVLTGLWYWGSWICKCSHLYCLTLAWKMPFHYPWNSIHLWLANKMLEISHSSPHLLHSSGKFWQPLK